jgi:hypothetical protein
MAFCGACGAASEGRFCGVCGMPTEMPAEGVAPVPPAPPAFAAPPVFAAPAVPAFEAPPPFVPPPAPPGPPRTQRELPTAPAEGAPRPSGSSATSISQQVRPVSVPPPPPLAARPPATGQADIARPADATAMIHHHADLIAAGTSVEIGPDDTFFGVVMAGGGRKVAFALMSGVRKTPEACEGFFVSRGVEGVELTHGGLALQDRKGTLGEVSVEGRMAFEIVDPVKLLTSDVPLDDDGLGSLVTGSMADAVDRALREGLTRGEYTMHELISGDADVRVLDRCTSERIGPKLVKSHGVSTEVAELRIRGALASDADSAVEAAPRAHHANVDAPSSDESTMEEPTFIERPEGSTSLLWRVQGSLPAGTVITVNADDNFLGLVLGEPPQQLPPGRHRVARALHAGLFVAQTGETTAFGSSLGSFKDFHGAQADVRVYGKVEVHVDDPLELVTGLVADGELAAIAPEEVMARVRGATIEVVRAVLRDGLSSGEWDLGGLSDPAEVEEVIRRAAKAYDTAPARLLGTTIEVLDLSVTTGEVARTDHALSTVRDQDRQTERDAPPPEMGTMHVRTEDIVHETSWEPPQVGHDFDADAERTMLPIPSMQYPPQEASRPREGHSEPPDSVMPTAISPPGYVQEVMQQLGPPTNAKHEPAHTEDPIDEGAPRMTLPSARPPAIEPAPAVEPIRAMPAPRPVGAATPAPAPAQPPLAAQANDPWRDFAPAVEQPTNGGPQPVPPPSGFAIGAHVLVMWSDGNRYPGQVHQATSDHCLVVFTNGHQQWVPLDALTGA